MEERLKKAELPVGHILNERWKIEGMISKSALGTISYEVSDGKRPNERFLLKAEAIVEVNKDTDIPTFLHMEMKLLLALKKNHSKNFVGVESGGECENIKFIVMGLLGRNLEDLRLQMPQQRFSLRTSLHIAQQTMQCLEDVHTTGFLHRDIKPGNMATGGTVKNLRRVYLINFELCRRYLDEKKSLRKTRSKVQFRGSPRYASVEALLGKEQGRVDDLWAWFQSIIEITVGKLPFNDLNGPSTLDEYLPWLAKRKIDVCQNPTVMLTECPNQFRQIFDHLQSLKADDAPKYSIITDAISEAMLSNENCNDAVPVDWEKGAAQQSTRSQKTKTS